MIMSEYNEKMSPMVNIPDEAVIHEEETVGHIEETAINE